ncbi:interleukin-17C-like [Discoglossus pictus]
MSLLCRMLVLGLFAILSINVCGGARSKHGKHHGRNPEQQHQYHCISMEDLDNKGESALLPFVGKNMKWEKYPAVYMVPHLDNDNKNQRKRRRREQVRSCPNLQTSSKSTLSERSISPWTYGINYDENRYPQKLAFAECLCSGCIDTQSGKEISSVNSVKIYQTMMVLRRKPCPTKPKLFTFEVDYEKVPVGCTCALPKY